MKIDGQTVADARKKLVLTITKKHVSAGDNKDPGACAAAQCILDLPEVERARVHIGRTYIQVGGKWTRFQTSPALRSEIIAFDRGGSFEPGTYTLNPISPAERAGRGKRSGSNKPGARDKGSKDRTPSKKRAKPHTVTGIRQHGANR